MSPRSAALTAADYDALWRALGDFIRLNPGARHRRRLTLRMLRGVEFDSVLDVGCGSGELLLHLHRARGGRGRWAGADLARETLETNRCAMPWAEFVEFDLVAGPLPDAFDSAFDLVLCCEVLEHLDDRARAFEHLAATVRPGGTLLVSCPTGRVFETERRFGHVSHPDARELEALGSACGLETERAANWGWPLYRALKWAANVDTDWSMRNFGSGSYSRTGRWLNHLLYVANFLNLDSRAGCQLFHLYRKPGGGIEPALATHVGGE